MGKIQIINFSRYSVVLVFRISNLVTNISWPLKHPSACSWVIVPFIRDTGAYILLDVYMLPRVLFLVKINSLTSPCLFQTTHFQHLGSSGLIQCGFFLNRCVNLGSSFTSISSKEGNPKVLEQIISSSSSSVLALSSPTIS